MYGKCALGNSEKRHAVNGMIDARLLEEVNEFRQSFGADEDGRLPDVPDSVLVDEASIFVDPAIPPDFLSPHEYIESISGRPIPSVYVPGNKEPNPPGPSDSLTNQSHCGPAHQRASLSVNTEYDASD